MRLSDHARVISGRTLGLMSIVGGLAGAILIVAYDGIDALVDTFAAHIAIIAVGFGAFAWLVVPQQPRNGAVWTLAWSAGFGGLYVAAVAWLILLASAAGLSNAETIGMTASDAMAAVGDVAAVPLFMVGMTTVQPLIMPITLGWLLFPDGRLPSPSWRWVTWFTGAVLVAAAIGVTFGSFVPGADVPLDADQSELTGWPRPVLDIASVLVMALVVLALMSLAVRFRRSEAMVRRQFRWIMWGGATFALSVFYPVFLGRPLANPSDAAVLIGESVLIAAYGIAITKYRLYDIDVIVSKTVVYGALAAFIAAVYVGVVVGIGAAFGGGTDPNPVLAIVATALVAVAFQPLRARLQKVANRIVYGKRATPYEVLSEFSRQVAATDETLLKPVARFLAEGTAASGAAIWTADDGYLKELSAWPVTETTPSLVPVDRDGGLAISGADVVLPIVHDGDLLGALALTLPPGQSLSRPDAALAEELTSGMGLALRNLRLTRALEERVEELRESRRRIVAVQDETRRRLERDLHDGAQQRLVALKVKLALAGQIASADGATRTVDFLGDLSAQADAAVAVLREFARGVYPPLLEAEGLRAALVSAAGRLPMAVDVAAHGVGRYSKELEATVYFCVLEALHNVVKFSKAVSAQVTLHADAESLYFEVRDAGLGFDPSDVTAGTGLLNMTDRMEAAGGTLTIESSPGGGTVVGGVIPVGGGRA